MAEPTTLRTLAGLPVGPVSLAESTLIMIDCQNTYTRGVMELEGVQAALDEAAALLDRARSAGIPIIHIQHDDGEGGLYDIRAELGAIVDRVAPRDGEPVVVKNYPNSFVETDLDERLKAGKASNLVIAGFMTHMCCDTTARQAQERGLNVIFLTDGTATRNLTLGDRTVGYLDVQAATLAAQADGFARLADVATVRAVLADGMGY